MLKFIAPAAAVFLASCASDPEIRYIEREIPRTLLTCEDEPAAPAGDYTQRDVGVFVLDLAEAGEDCRRKLGKVRGLTGSIE